MCDIIPEIKTLAGWKNEDFSKNIFISLPKSSLAIFNYSFSERNFVKYSRILVKLDKIYQL